MKTNMFEMFRFSPSYEGDGSYDDIEIIPPDEPEEDEDDGKVTLSREEVEALKQKADSTEQLRQSFLEYAEKAAPANKRPEEPEPQQPGETDEQFQKRIEKEIFEEGKTTNALREFIDRYAGPVVNQQNAQLAEANKKLLLMDSETGPKFRKYKSEIEEFVASLPRVQQSNPEVWNYAYREVVNGRHSDDEMQDIIERKVQEKLREMGLADAEEGAEEIVQQRTQQAISTRNASVSPQRKVKRVRATEADRKNAAESGVSLEHYMKYYKR